MEMGILDKVAELMEGKEIDNIKTKEKEILGGLSEDLINKKNNDEENIKKDKDSVEKEMINAARSVVLLTANDIKYNKRPSQKSMYDVIKKNNTYKGFLYSFLNVKGAEHLLDCNDKGFAKNLVEQVAGEEKAEYWGSFRTSDNQKEYKEKNKKDMNAFAKDFNKKAKISYLSDFFKQSLQKDMMLNYISLEKEMYQYLESYFGKNKSLYKKYKREKHPDKIWDDLSKIGKDFLRGYLVNNFFKDRRGVGDFFKKQSNRQPRVHLSITEKLRAFQQYGKKIVDFDKEFGDYLSYLNSIYNNSNGKKKGLYIMYNKTNDQVKVAHITKSSQLGIGTSEPQNKNAKNFFDKLGVESLVDSSDISDIEKIDIEELKKDYSGKNNIYNSVKKRLDILGDKKIKIDGIQKSLSKYSFLFRDNKLIDIIKKRLNSLQRNNTSRIDTIESLLKYFLILPDLENRLFFKLRKDLCEDEEDLRTFSNEIKEIIDKYGDKMVLDSLKDYYLKIDPEYALYKDIKYKFISMNGDPYRNFSEQAGDEMEKVLSDLYEYNDGIGPKRNGSGIRSNYCLPKKFKGNLFKWTKNNKKNMKKVFDAAGVFISISNVASSFSRKKETFDFLNLERMYEYSTKEDLGGPLFIPSPKKENLKKIKNFKPQKISIIDQIGLQNPFFFQLDYAAYKKKRRFLGLGYKVIFSLMYRYYNEHFNSFNNFLNKFGEDKFKEFIRYNIHPIFEDLKSSCNVRGINSIIQTGLSYQLLQPFKWHNIRTDNIVSWREKNKRFSNKMQWLTKGAYYYYKKGSKKQLPRSHNDKRYWIEKEEIHKSLKRLKQMYRKNNKTTRQTEAYYFNF